MLVTFPGGKSVIAEYVSPERELRMRSEFLDDYIFEHYPDWDWDMLIESTKEICQGSYELEISSQLSLMFDVYGVCPIDFLEYLNL